LREAPIEDLDDDNDDWDDDEEGAPRQLSSAEKFVDVRFQELEIYVPDCYAVRREADVWLEGNHSLPMIGKTAVLEHF
jgi:hypothetical protein